MALLRRVCWPPLRIALGAWAGVPVEFAPDGLIAQSIGGFFIPTNFQPPAIIQTLSRSYSFAREITNRGEAAVTNALQSLYVGDYVLDLLLVQNILERGHQRVAIFDPGFQGVFGELVVVHGKRAALGNSF